MRLATEPELTLALAGIAREYPDLPPAAPLRASTVVVDADECVVHLNGPSTQRAAGTIVIEGYAVRLRLGQVTQVLAYRARVRDDGALDTLPPLGS
jgi:hypothetical protein